MTRARVWLERGSAQRGAATEQRDVVVGGRPMAYFTDVGVNAAARWRLAMAAASLVVACSGSTAPVVVARKPVPAPTATAFAAVAPPVVSVAVPEPRPCPPVDAEVEAGPLAEAPLSAALPDVPTGEWRDQVAAALGVAGMAPCNDRALVQAIARFQRRYGRFEDEVTGRINARTKRNLQAVHAELRAADHPCVVTPPAAAGGLPSCLLRWPGATPEQLAFMRKVYEVAQQRASRRRPFVMAADEVDVIERGPCPGKPSTLEPGCQRTQWAQRDAAHAARRLLDDARAAFASDAKQHGQRNLMVYTGYRSAPFQLEIWEYHFPGRYQATARARARSRGGPHGDAAALLLAQYFGVRTAPPGFSLHGRGVAIDFGCVTRDGDWIGSTGSFARAWKGSYCFRWLKDNAPRYGFRLNDSIDEPWHWEFAGKVAP